MNHGKSRSSLIRLLQVLFLLLFCFSLFMVWREYSRGKAEQEAFESLNPNSVLTESNAALETLESSFAPYIALHEENPDFAGWLTVENTRIDYPVMYTPESPQFYLRRAFDKSWSLSGTPFLGEGCDMDSDCVIIYGHNMKNGTMFGTLDRYLEEEFWEKSPSLTLTTPTETRSYEIFAAVRCRILSVDEKGFRYYDSAGDLSETEHAALLDWLEENACYQTGIRPAYGEQILLLSTCSYHTEDGRFVVAARRTDEQASGSAQ